MHKLNICFIQCQLPLSSQHCMKHLEHPPTYIQSVHPQRTRLQQTPADAIPFAADGNCNYVHNCHNGLFNRHPQRKHLRPRRSIWDKYPSHRVVPVGRVGPDCRDVHLGLALRAVLLVPSGLVGLVGHWRRGLPVDRAGLFGRQDPVDQGDRVGEAEIGVFS